MILTCEGSRNQATVKVEENFEEANDDEKPFSVDNISSFLLNAVIYHGS
jgi:hypothetical protein